MDYGHTNNRSAETPASFFTPGVGNADPGINASGPSINSDTVGQVREHSTRELAEVTTENEGAKPVTMGLSDLPQGQNVLELASTDLGVIRDTMPTPPARVNSALGRAALTAHFHPQGDHISDDTVSAMDNLVSDLKDTTKSLADTYDATLAARQAYLAAAGFVSHAEENA